MPGVKWPPPIAERALPFLPRRPSCPGRSIYFLDAISWPVGGRGGGLLGFAGPIPGLCRAALRWPSAGFSATASGKGEPGHRWHGCAVGFFKKRILSYKASSDPVWGQDKPRKTEPTVKCPDCGKMYRTLWSLHLQRLRKRLDTYTTGIKIRHPLSSTF